MLDNYLELTIGALLHDIGKIIYREGGDKRTHSQSGYEFLKEYDFLRDRDGILDPVRYHHAMAIKGAEKELDPNAYIVYMADNLASSVDRRKKDIPEAGFEIHTPLRPVFNLLNNNKGNMFYSPTELNMEEQINYPSDEKKQIDSAHYKKIVDRIQDNLHGIELSESYVNSLLEVLEANLAFIPAATSNEEVQDISLFEHLKLTAALSCCIKGYLEENGDEDYREKLFIKGVDFYDEKCVMMASLDVSGIQKFIYTIHTKNALKNLRARSFYLEIMMEHMIDELLGEEGLSRANILYSGGGHCYMIFPGTQKAKSIFDGFIKKTNAWFLEHYQTRLYIAGGTTLCSGNDLKNVPDGSYAEIFRKMSADISRMKMNRYSASEILSLNRNEAEDYTRECSVCKSVAVTDENGRCSVCAAFEKASSLVLGADFFSIVKREGGDQLPLPGGYCVVQDDENSLKKRMEEDEYFVRAYSKNRSFVGKNVATKLWVGDYTTRGTFSDFAANAQGISRVGILRADVDNLGHAFVSGFCGGDDRYVTISRTATLSRQLSLFFKLHINKILRSPVFTLNGIRKEKRDATIVYSGGDDIFVVGAWDDIVEFAIDFRRAFDKFSEGTLTISAGIGLYDDKYPISVSAAEVEEMVDSSKMLPSKNGITLLEDGEFHTVCGISEEYRVSDGTYSWEEFEEKVISEKYRLISGYMDGAGIEHGNALLYRMLELIRRQDDRISFARFVYLISRLEPDGALDSEKKESFEEFSRKMAGWIRNQNDCRHLKTAIELYVYLSRDKEVTE